MSILIVGDLHFQIQNFIQVEQFCIQIYELLKKDNIVHVIFLGDILHCHDKLDTIVLNYVLNFFNNIVKICNITVLVGNHDMINNTNYCNPQGHWMNCLKLNDKIKIVDVPMALDICGLKFLGMPYVYVGRFNEALNDYNFNPNDFDFCLAHQEFKDCKMGAFNSTKGDEYNFNTLCISGHIHNYQKYNNILYTGSAFEHSFGSSKCFLFLINVKSKEIEKIDSIVESKNIFYKKLKFENEKFVLNSKLKMPSSGKKLNKLVIEVESLQNFKEWLIGEEGKLVEKNYIITYKFIESNEKENYKNFQKKNDVLDNFLFEIEKLNSKDLKNLLPKV